MKENYRAWQINDQDFYRQKSRADQLRFLIKFAVLAPSSHNSQPWSFKIKDETIFLLANLDRALPVSDADHRQLFISLGGALENLLTAADYYGFITVVEYFSAGTGGDTVAKVSFQEWPQEKKAAKETHPAFSIPRRHTNRNKYTNQPLDQGFLDWIQISGDTIRVDLVQELSKKERLAEITIKAGLKAMDDKGFREELSRYVKSNLTNSKLGMPGFGLGLPTPISLLAPLLIRYLNMNRLTRRKDEELLKKFTPLFAVISTKRDDPENWVKAGQLYERIALQAEKRQIKTHIMAAAVQVGNFHRELQEVLNTTFRPQVFFRLGYSQKVTPHSPRLSVNDV